MDEQIAAVETEIRKICEAIEEFPNVQEMLKYSEEEKMQLSKKEEQLRKKEEQLRKEEEQLREEKLLLLRISLGTITGEKDSFLFLILPAIFSSFFKQKILIHYFSINKINQFEFIILWNWTQVDN